MKSLLSKLITDALLFQVLLWVALLVFENVSQEQMPVWVLILLIINALLYIVAAYLVIREDTPLLYVVAGFLVVNIVLAFFDQMGAIDIVILIVNSGTFVFVVWSIMLDFNATE